MTTQLPAWAEYHVASRIYRGRNPSPADLAAADILVASERIYPLAERVAFDPESAGLVPGVADLFEVLRGRRSCREFSSDTVPRAIVDSALSVGFVGSTLTGRRPTPSAGALYPIEVWLIPLQVSGMSPGVYHLRAHPMSDVRSWERVTDPPEQDGVDDALSRQLPTGSAGVLVLAASIAKSTAKYGERGYRFCLLEAGHVAQNLTLVLKSFAVESVCLGGFADYNLNQILGLDGVMDAAVYAIPFGFAAAKE